VPRGIDFLFNKNRLNVAISRAQCIAVLVHSPRLLDADCRTLEAMAVVDGVCRLVELANARKLPVTASRVAHS
jgi:superfamily I DNA and/or RNA helicase